MKTILIGDKSKNNTIIFTSCYIDIGLYSQNIFDRLEANLDLHYINVLVNGGYKFCEYGPIVFSASEQIPTPDNYIFIGIILSTQFLQFTYIDHLF